MSPTANGYGWDHGKSVGPASEATAPIAERDRHIIVCVVGGDEVEVAITVQIAIAKRVLRMLAHFMTIGEFGASDRPPLPSPNIRTTPYCRGYQCQILGFVAIHITQRMSSGLSVLKLEWTRGNVRRQYSGNTDIARASPHANTKIRFAVIVQIAG